MSAPWGITAFAGAPVVEWPPGAPAPQPPPGTAGISVWLRNRATDPPHYGHRHQVGIDDTPLWSGIGRAVAFVAPGEHRAEVRHNAVIASVRAVRVHAGEVAELEFWTPATFGSVSQGVLVPAPAGRRMGSGPGLHVSVTVVYGTLLLLLLLRPDDNSTPMKWFFLVFGLAGPFVGVLAISRIKRRLDRRYRVAVSAEARATPRDVMFLAEGDAPAGLADAGTGHGALVVTCVLAERYIWNGRTGLIPIDRDPNSWVPAPALTIDGRPQPFGFLTWAYRLPAGPHTLTVTPRPPVPAPIGAAWAHVPPPRVTPEVAVTPGTVPVEIVAGRLTRLVITLDATVAVRFLAPSDSAPTVPTGFTATVSARTVS
ncbi:MULTISPECIES: hypothetical protein [Catenuloplanes]|uniref:Uncharacterized protein n=1 Tax=Catenuloplanes niger TaxID=587534 RepID=A0AAE3ZZB1_9ACTN|nr:hypothetical protein [Catenuloplanes niger]MDR7327999.1 hypothetical protein [Catenuloplanes niger]